MTITAAELRALAENPPDNATDRRELYNAAKSLMYAVEAPMDTEHRLFFVAAPYAAVATVSDLNIFEMLAAEPSRVWKVEELAKASVADPTLLHRLLRYVTITGLIKEVSEGIFAASNLTTTAASPSFKSGLRFHEGSKNLLSLPKFLSETSYRNPTDPKASLFAKLHGAGITEVLMRDPQRAASVFEYMAQHRKQLPTWTNGTISTKDFHMTDEDHKAGRVMMVDVGGGAGHQCLALRDAFPRLEGKMIVQDMAVMIDMINKDQATANDLEPMAHDFFTPQPITHAKVYYLRNVLHDWSDEPAAKILQQLRPAMASDSVIVIDEIVIPPTGANHKLLHYDLAMMATASAMERTEKQWRALIESCGLKVRDAWIYDESMQWALIVAVPE